MSPAMMLKKYSKINILVRNYQDITQGTSPSIMALVNQEDLFIMINFLQH